MEPLLTANDVARILRIPRNEVYDLVARCGLPAHRVGKRRLRFRPADLAAWLTSTSTSTASGSGRAGDA